VGPGKGKARDGTPAAAQVPDAQAALASNADAKLAERLAAWHATGAAAWPGLELPPALFAGFVGARVRDTTPAGWASLHVADLYLACACAARVPGAVERFDRHVGATLAMFVRAIDAAPGFVDEVAQVLKAKLFVGREDQPPRIGDYRGTGPLAAWVGVAAQRTALVLRRGESAMTRAHRRAFEQDPDPTRDPELAHLKRRYKGVFEEAFRDAFVALSDHHRALLRLHLCSGLTLERIGSIYSVNASTVWRWLDAARRRLLAETERLLHERLRVSSEEFASLARLVSSQLDVSVASLLGGGSAAPPDGRRGPR
jgi:RNA polymerase sigma-70 factor (ECF subfamily)